MTTLPKLITADVLAEHLGEHIKTIRTRTRRGDFKEFAINVGTQRSPRWRYDTARLAKWLDSRRAA